MLGRDRAWGVASYRQWQGGRDTHVSMAKKVRGEGIRSTMARTRGAVGGLDRARVLLVQEVTVETRGTGTNSMPSCARWCSERATSGIVAFPSTQDPKRKTVSPLISQRRGEHNQTRFTQRIQTFLYKNLQKPREHQLFDEMIKALHISEKCPKFTVC